jgi:hypothetical protein
MSGEQEIAIYEQMDAHLKAGSPDSVTNETSVGRIERQLAPNSTREFEYWSCKFIIVFLDRSARSRIHLVTMIRIIWSGIKSKQCPRAYLNATGLAPKCASVR